MSDRLEIGNLLPPAPEGSQPVGTEAPLSMLGEDVFLAPGPTEIMKELEDNLSDEAFKSFQGILEQASAGDDQQKAKILNSLILPMYLQNSPQDAYDNQAGYIRTMTGKDDQPKGFLQKLGDYWRAGQTDVYLIPLVMRRMFGDYSPELKKQIDALRASQPAPTKLFMDQDPETHGASGSWGKGYLLRKEAWQQFGRYARDFLNSFKKMEDNKETIFRVAAYEAARMAPQSLYAIKEGLSWGAVGAGAGLAGLGIAAAYGVPTEPLAPWVMSLFRVGMTYGSFSASAQMEATQAYLELEDISFTDKDGRTKKLDPLYAAIAAWGVGVVNGAIEVAQVERLLKPFGGDKLFKEAVSEATLKALRDGTLKKMIGRWAAKWGVEVLKDYTIEVAQEGMQELVAILGEELSKYISNKVKDTEFEQNWKGALPRIMETMGRAALGMSLMVVGGRVLSPFKEGLAQGVIHTFEDKAAMEGAIKDLQNRHEDMTRSEALEILNSKIEEHNQPIETTMEMARHPDLAMLKQMREAEGKEAVAQKEMGAQMAALVPATTKTFERRFGIPSEFSEMTAEEFVSERDRSTRTGYLFPYSAEEIVAKKFQVFGKRAGTGSVGYALTAEMDLVNVFNNTGIKGLGSKAIVDAIARGARTLDAYEGFLTQKYHDYGFRPTKVVQWSDEFSPPGWNYDRDGRPNIIFMEWRGTSRDPVDVERSAGTAGRYIPSRERPGLEGYREVYPELGRRKGQGLDTPKPGETPPGIRVSDHAIVPERFKFNKTLPKTFPRPQFAVQTRDGTIYYHPEARDYFSAAEYLGLDAAQIDRLGVITKGGNLRYMKGWAQPLAKPSEKLKSRLQEIAAAAKWEPGQADTAHALVMGSANLVNMDPERYLDTVFGSRQIQLVDVIRSTEQIKQYLAESRLKTIHDDLRDPNPLPALAQDKSEKNVEDHIRRFVSKAIKDLDWAARNLSVEKFREARGWYGPEAEATIDALSKREFPGLGKTDWQVRLMWLVTAITSQQTSVDENFHKACNIMHGYLENSRFSYGNIPGKGERALAYYKGAMEEVGGKAGETVWMQFKKIERLIEQFGGIEEALTWLSKQHPGKEILKAFGKPVTQKWNDITPEGMHWPGLGFGPKVGAFFSNLVAQAKLPVFDTWLVRIYTRYMGEEARIAKSILTDYERAVLYEAFDALSEKLNKIKGQKWSADEIQAVLWYSEKERYKRQGYYDSGISYREVADDRYRRLSERDPGQLWKRGYLEQAEFETQITPELRQYSSTVPNRYGQRELFPEIPARGPAFYPYSVEVLREKIRGPMPGRQILKTLQANGVKTEEMLWTGIDELLETDERLNPKEVEEFIWNNQVAIKEVVRTDEEDSESPMTKFSQWILPDGNNYRELLLIWDVPDVMYKGPHWDEENIIAHVRFTDRMKPTGERILFIEEIQSDWYQAGREKGFVPGKKEFKVLKKTVREYFEEGVEKTEHWMQWAETQMGVYLDSVRRNIEEGHLPGIKEIHPDSPMWVIYDRQGNKIGAAISEDRVSEFIEDNIATDHKGKVLIGPMSKSWHEFAFKRMLRWAVDNGYEGIGWTTGAQQKERYHVGLVLDGWSFQRVTEENLSEIARQRRVAQRHFKIGEYVVEFHRRGTSFSAWDRLEGEISPEDLGREEPEWERYSFTLDEIERIAGHEMVMRMEEAESGYGIGEVAEVEFEDPHEVGKKTGMNVFYDEVLPSFAKKYLKKWYGSVEMSEIFEPREAIWYVPITETMRISVSAGQTFFAPKSAAAVQFLKNNQALILATKQTTFNDFMHEMGHIYLENLPMDMQQVVRSWGGLKEDEPLSRKLHEDFANGLLKWLYTAEAPAPELVEPFKRAKKWIGDVVDAFEAELAPQVRLVYESIWKPAYRQAPARATTAEIAETEELNDRVVKNLENADEAAAIELRRGKIADTELQRAWAGLRNIWHANRDERNFRARVRSANIKENIQAVLKTGKADGEAWDKAIHIAIDLPNFKGDLDKALEKLPKEKQDLVDKAKNLPEALKPIVEEIKKVYSDMLAEGRDAEVLHNARENYAARAWDLGEERPATEAGTKFKTTTRHAKYRKLNSVIDGWLRGYELKIETASKNLETYEIEITRAIENKKFLAALSKLKDSEGNPLLRTKRQPGYELVDHPNFKAWKWRGKLTAKDITEPKKSDFSDPSDWEEAMADWNPAEPEDLELPPMEIWSGKNAFVTTTGDIFERMDIYAPKEIADKLNNILGHSSLMKLPGIKALTRFNAIIKHTILSSSLFHHLAFMRSYYLGTRQSHWADVNFIHAYKMGKKAIATLQPELIQLIRGGLTLGVVQDWEEDLLEDRGKLDHLLKKFGPYRVITDAMRNWRHMWTQALFESFGSGLKAKCALTEYAHQLKKHPDLDPEQLAINVANLVNDDFGGLNLERIGRNPTAQHIMRLLLLAPDWTESNFRTAVKAFGFTYDEGLQWGKITRAEWEIYAMFWVQAFTKGLAMSAFCNFILAGGDPEEFLDNYKKALRDGDVRVLDVNVTPIYMAFNKAMGLPVKSYRRKYFSILGHFKDPIKWFGMNPVKSMKYKGSVGATMMLEMLTRTDWAGRQFTTWSELINTGRTVLFYSRDKAETDYEWLPSYIINQLVGATPVQVQNLIQALSGEMEVFDALSNSLGLGVRTTY